MNLGKELIAHVLRTGDLKPFLDAGLGLDWLSSKTDFTSSAIFTQHDEEAYGYILRHHEKHRKVPSLDLFRHTFPKDAYRIATGDFDTDEILALVQDDIREARVAQGAQDILDLYESGQFDKAAEVMAETARRIRHSRANKSLVTHWLTDPDYDVEDKINRVIEQGLKTGVYDLDQSFHGFRKGSLITYLGTAKAGKTSFLIMAALHAWAAKKRVLFVTVEMTGEEIEDRLDCMGAGVSLERYQDGKLSRKEKDQLRAFQDRVNGDESFTVLQTLDVYTIADLEDDIDRCQPDLVCVDGFYFMTDADSGKTGAHWEGHDNLARGMKEIAMRRNLTIITTMQVREKQLKRGEMEDAAMMGGTGLIMASSYVFGFYKDNDDGTVTISNTRSRTKYLPRIRGRWNWETAEFTAIEEEEEYDDASQSF